MLGYVKGRKISIKYVFLAIFIIYITVTINLFSWVSKSHPAERKLRTGLVEVKNSKLEIRPPEKYDSEIDDTQTDTGVDNHIILENIMRRKRKILAELIQEYQQSQDATNKSHFQFQSIGNISVFSAFYDDRLNLDFDVAVVRILGIAKLDSSETLVCRYTDKGVDSWVLASKFEMCENHDKIYGGYVYVCNTPHNLEFVPPKVYLQSLNNLNSDKKKGNNKSVSLDLVQVKRKLTMKALLGDYDYGFEDNFYTSDEDGDSEDRGPGEGTNISNNDITERPLTASRNDTVLKVTDSSNKTFQGIKARQLKSNDIRPEHDNGNQSTESTTDKVAVCVSPLFGDIKLSNFIQFIEFHKLQNVHHFFFYAMNISNDLTKVLRHYESENLATIISWKLPDAIKDQIWYNGQIVSIQDCLYRAMGHYDYIAFLDIDEVIVPRLDSDWSELLHRLNNQNPETDKGFVIGYSFKSAFFDPEKSQEISIESPKRLKLSLLENTERNKILSKVRSKLIIKPEFVIEMGIHHVSQTLNMLINVTMLDINPSIARVHHYRSCTTVSDKNMVCGDFVTDDTILRFEDSLVTNYMDTVRKNIKHFKKV